MRFLCRSFLRWICSQSIRLACDLGGCAQPLHFVYVRLLTEFAAHVGKQTAIGRGFGFSPFLKLDDVPAELRFHRRLGDLAGFKREGGFQEFGYHHDLGKGSKLAALKA